MKDAQAASVVERIREFAMPHGASPCHGTWLRQEGEMRFAPDKPWMPFRAEQWFFGGVIEFRWKAWVRMTALIRARVVDSFEGGRGTLRADAFGFIPVARSQGSATDRGEAMRGLAELPWRPFVFGAGPSLLWESAENDELRARFDDAHTQAEVLFKVDSAGQVQSAFARDRPRLDGARVVETAWSGVFGEYRALNGIRVPTVAEAFWLLREGPFSCWRAHVTEFRILR